MSDLEEKFEALRGQGLSDKEIVREIFQEDLNADVSEIQRITGMEKLEIGRIKGQVSRWRKPPPEVAEGEGGEGEGEVSEEEERRLVAQFGREGLNKVKRARLLKVLSLAPGMSSKTIPWIMHKYDINSRLRDDPQEFYRVLHDECGLKPNIAFSIVRDVFTVEEEFADLLYQRGEQPIFFRPGYGAQQQQQPFFGGGYGQPPAGPSTAWPMGYPQQTTAWPGGGPGGGPQPFLTREEFMRMMKEDREEGRLIKVEDKLNKLDKDFGGALSGLEERLLEKIDTAGGGFGATQFEEVREYIDKKGEICDPEKAVSVRVRKVPIAPKESTEVKELREEIRGLHKTIQDKEVASLKDEIKELKGLISKKPEGPEESSAFKELKTRFDQTENRYGELKEKIEAEDRKRLEDTIKDLRSRMDVLATRPAGEYKSDEYRLLADAIHGLQRTLEAKKPIEVVERVLTPGAQTQPPPSAAGEVERGGVLQGLRPHGLVTRVVERVRG